MIALHLVANLNPTRVTLERSRDNSSKDSMEAQGSFKMSPDASLIQYGKVIQKTHFSEKQVQSIPVNGELHPLNKNVCFFMWVKGEFIGVERRKIEHSRE